MKRALTHSLAVVGFTCAACWDAWRWYGARVAATPEEAIALALTVALVFAIGSRRFLPSPQSRIDPAQNRVISGTRTSCTEGSKTPYVPIAMLLALYAAAELALPPIVAAAIAVTAVLYALYRLLTGEHPPLAFYGLVALSLPVLPSLQFMLGYPMRIVSASITVALLQVQGLAVSREGTHMLWRGETIQFDAPCSGVNMLWAGLMLTLAACVVWRAGWRMTAIAVAASMLLTLAANVLRAVSLFYVEAGLIAGAAPWWHEAIGIAAFALAAAGTMKLLTHLRDQEASWAR
jgi:exosortase/archaeosortase family protein